MYKQSIIIFGIIIPLLIASAIIGGALYFKGNISASYLEKKQQYASNETNRIGTLGIEAQVNRQRATYDRWQELLKEETVAQVSSNLRAIGESLPPKEFQQTPFERLPQSVGFGGVSIQKSSGLKLNFRGSFRTVQLAFLELETRMPNLQLQDLNITPITADDSSLLNFQVTYSVWEN